MHADRDGAGWRTRQRRREDDLEFLARVRAADWPTLRREAENLAHKKAPKWKVVAVLRALGRLFARRD